MKSEAEKKKEGYKQVKMMGIAMLFPFVLAAGPLGGHFVGEYLRHRFNLGQGVSVICIVLGFVSSIIEAIRLVMFAIRTDKE